ncbi:NUDIX domain-containing protein [Lentzea sp. HUAS TT2]|uniref:NUDIX domain-containing protein n=1 Tax=Lentzea sp. HUAS TT2 TaxID=3447454 RepID=UPI003F7234BA
MADLTGKDQFAYFAEGNAKQARKRVAADVLLRDEQGRVVLVNPTYKDFWDLPGGMAESNEPPAVAAAREVREELGVQLSIGRILLLDWEAPHGPWDDQLVFVFDGGVLGPDLLKALRVSDPEISEFEIVEVNEALRRLRPDMANKLERALAAAESGTFDYAEKQKLLGGDAGLGQVPS